MEIAQHHLIFFFNFFGSNFFVFVCSKFFCVFVFSLEVDVFKPVPTTANQQLRLKSKNLFSFYIKKKIFSSNIKKAFLSTFLWQNFVQHLFLVRFYCLIAYHVVSFTILLQKEILRGKDNQLIIQMVHQQDKF
jgi:hypothetical protein